MLTLRFFAPILRRAAAGSLILALFISGCAKQKRPETERDAEAHRLYDRADLMVRHINEGAYSYDYINFHYLQAMRNIDRIQLEYPETPTGQKIKAGDLKLGPYSVDYFRNTLLAQLGDMKEATESAVNCAIYLYDLPQAAPAQSHRALAQILETLCRLVRSDEAMTFPVLPADQVYAQQTIVKIVAEGHQHDQAESIIDGADPAVQPDLASAYGEGLAIGGAKPEELDELIQKYPTPDKRVEAGVLQGMIQREAIGYRDSHDKVKQKREREALEALAKSHQPQPKAAEAPVRYDIAGFYQTRFGGHPPAAAAAAYAGMLALEGRLDDARQIAAGLDEAARVTVISNHYEHLALTDALTGHEDLGARWGLSADGQARCQLALVDTLAANARYTEADALEREGIARHPALRDQFIRRRMHGVFYSREQLFYLDAKTIPNLGINDPAVCAEVLLDWFLSPNRLQKGSSWGADQIIFKYFSMQKEGRPLSRKLAAEQ